MLNPLTFEYHQPSDVQADKMDMMRKQFARLAELIEAEVPESPDRTFVIRGLRTVAMWTNVAITRHADGSPRK